MKSSVSIVNLAKALLVAQKQMGAAVKGSKNPFFKSNYADLPTVMEVVKEPLNDAGIVVLQPATYHAETGKNYISTTLIHSESGEWIQGDTEVKMGDKQGPQDFGSAQTYARRFSLQSMLFIPAEDDDGNGVSGRAQTTKPVYTPKVTTVTNISTATVETQMGELKSALQDTPPIQMEPLKKTSSFSKKNKPAPSAPAVTLAPEQQADFE